MEIESESMKLQFYIMIVPVVTKSGDKCGNVATAAPVTPIFGAPRSPKIKIGSRMMLVIAPVSWEVILKMVLPVEVRRRSKKTCASSPKEKIMTVLKYSIPSSMISWSAFPI